MTPGLCGWLLQYQPFSTPGTSISNILLMSTNDIAHQGVMQDKIIASHTRFGRHVDVNC